MTNEPQKPIAVFLGHHKCATSWVNTIAEDIASKLGLKFAIVSDIREFDRDLPRFVAEKKVDVLSYSNAKVEHVRTLSNFRGFHVIRDPRDIVVSAYYSHLYSHSTTHYPALISHREKLKSVSKDEGLRIEMDYRRNEMEDLSRWDYHLPNVMEMKMEDMIVNPYEQLLEAFSFIGLAEARGRSTTIELLAASANWMRARTRGYFPSWLRPKTLAVPEFLAVVHRNRFSAKSGGRKPGDEDVHSHYRKGVAGDWVNHFSPENRQYFKSNYGELLQKLGYEQSMEW